MASLRQLAASILFHTGRMADRAARVSHYLAAGTLTLAEMRESIRTSWDDFYSTDAAPRPVLLRWEEALLERFIPTGSAVLLIGCGNGRDLVALAERGYRVTGVEPAAAAIREARRQLLARHVEAALVEEFFEDASIAGRFDLVIFSYYSYAFIPVSSRRTDALKKAAALLNPGGHVLVSHAARTPRPHRFLISGARCVGRLCASDWRLEPGDVVWNDRRIRRAYSYTHAFAPGELEREVAAAGLTPVFRQPAEDQSVVLLGRS